MGVSKFPLGDVKFEVFLEIHFKCWEEVKPEDKNVFVIVRGMAEAMEGHEWT